MRTRMALALAALSFALANCANADEFTPDKHTLFLAHFNDNAKEADYAMGWREFGGSGARLTEGYYGKAIDLRGTQFQADFLSSCAARVPMFVEFGIWPRGNVVLRQGTFEFWFQVSPDGMKQNRMGQSLFFTHYYQPAARSIAGVYLTSKAMTWKWHALNGDPMEGKVSFSPPLRPDDWHHYAMCWSPGETAIYVDGRCVGAHDMTDKNGLLLVAQTHRDIAMNGVALDELRISDVTRYAGDFEPAWRDGARPGYAFAGAASVRRYPQNPVPPYLPAPAPAPSKGAEVAVRIGQVSLSFDRATGCLTFAGLDGKTAERGANGLLLWEGVDRNPLPQPRASQWEVRPDGAAFEQRFGEIVLLRHDLRETNGQVRWNVTFANLSGKELWLEALLSLPLPFDAVREYFDMSCVQTQLPMPRRRDEYVFSLPFAAAAGEAKAVGVGIDPNIGLSALISEWVPEGNSGTIRQGTRIVLDPGEEYTLDFLIVHDDAEFGTLNVVAKYHEQFPDLYRQKPDVPIYSYMPICRYFEWLPAPDLARLCHVGNQWGHGPAHCKGDEWGTPKYWDMPKDPNRPDHAYLAKIEKVWGSLDGMRAQMLTRSKNSYDSFYTLRRTHYLPNWPQRFIVEDVWPEGMKGDDPLVCGQYYDQMYYANEFNTPLGKRYKESTRHIMDHIGAWSPGFINDMCHTSPFRFTDAIARKTPGCAFSRDRGRYLVGAFGHVDRYRMINGYVDNRGFRQSIWSDGGVVSYMLCAHSAAAAIESYIIPEDMTFAELGHKAGRNLLGEKPFAVHYEKENDYLGKYFAPGDFTPKALREYYGYCHSQILLSALRHGIYLPYDVTEGLQAMTEMNPILVESIVLGRKIVPGARVPDPLFVRRSGEGMTSFLAVGNEQPKEVTGDVEIVNRFFGDGAPIFGAYFGGEVREEVGDSITKIKMVTVPPRSVAAFKALGMLRGKGRYEVESSFTGDGLRLSVQVRIKGDAPARLALGLFGPIYELADAGPKAVRCSWLNAKPPESVPEKGMVVIPDVPAGGGQVAVELRSRALQFSREDWDAVELIRDGKTGFALIAPTASPFNAGTAGMLNDFIAQYDEEDGALGNLTKADLSDKAPEGFPGWKIFINAKSDAMPSRVRIVRDAKEIHVEGRSSGEARRAMAVFLRLLDRKYPHVGRFFSLRSCGGDCAKLIEKRLKIKETQQFFRDFSDKDFLIKPILSSGSEGLYENGNRNFQGKYALRCAPYLFEPTYADNYVYGYAGE